MRVSQGGRVPLVAVHVVDRDEGRLAPHRQANVAGAKLLVDLVAELLDRPPLLLGIGLGDARVFMDPLHVHVMLERGLTDIVLVLAGSLFQEYEPVIGAAVSGSAVQARGIWPSPASRPEVGSRPTQPAPGRYTSAQACRSVKSTSVPRARRAT